MAEITVEVAGMSCGHCVAAVTEELKKISGVTDVAVELGDDRASKVSIQSDAALAQQDIAQAIDEAGYQMAT